MIVGAHNDAYVSPASIRELAAHWPGSEVKFVLWGRRFVFTVEPEPHAGQRAQLPAGCCCCCC